MRIIGGQWKRSKLSVPDRPGLRPTPDRVRETLFNWLGQTMAGFRCIDAFAGSGALGLEAASRGAAQVLLIEKDPGLAQAIRGHALRLKALGVEVRTGDALDHLKASAPGVWDVVFLDPPFGQGQNDGLFIQALAAARPLLVPGGWVYLEAPRMWTDGELETLGWQALKRGKAGAVHHHLLVWAER